MKKVVSLFILLIFMVSFMSINVSAETQYSANLIPVMTSNTAPSGIASASSEAEGNNYAAWKAFDNSLYTGSGTYYWGTLVPYGWIAYEFPVQHVISKYTIKCVMSYFMPKNWTFEGTNDGTNWVVLDTQSNITWTSGETKTITMPNTDSFKKYRINVSAVNNGSQYVGIDKIEMMERLGSLPNNPTLQIPISENSKVELFWTASTGAASYNIKRANSPGGIYTTIGTTSSLNYTDTSVTNGNTYYYVVTAINADGGQSINSNEVSATPSVSIPADPAALASTSGNTKVDLSWTVSAGATSYNVKRAATAGGPYTTIATGLTTASYTDTAVTNGITYYYVVTAVNSSGESANSNEASATPIAPPATIIEGNKAILAITMMNGTVKEYDMTAAEIEAFVNWYDDKENGIAGTKAYFAIKKKYNIKPFLNRWDYIVFSKIQDFEIKDYNE